MKLPVKRSIIGLLMIVLITVSGCSPSTTQEQTITPPNVNVIGGKGQESGNNVAVLNSVQTANLPITNRNGVSYVVGNDLANVLQLNTKWDAGRGVYQLGDFDAAYELKMGSTEAVVDDNNVRLTEPPILHNSLVYIPVTSLEALFKDYMSFQLTADEVRINPTADWVLGSANDPEEPNTGGALDFMDDPKDPFKGKEPAADATKKTTANFRDSENMLSVSLSSDSPEAIPAALQHIDIDGMLNKAKQYLGVKYLFGAPPYPQSNKFDCSTYTKYIYSRYGVSLGRTARAQSLMGTDVSRSQLRKGDLLFFYVPGRFRSNKTVGHVAMYLGDSRMIHASPQPENGVQITNINKNYWKRTFLKAKRISY